MTHETQHANTNNAFSTDRLVRIFLLIAITYWSFELIRPFLGLLAWGFILAVALHPPFVRLSKHLGNHPVVASCILTLMSLLIVVSVLSILTNSMVSSLSLLITQIRSGHFVIPPPPASVNEWPMIGPQVHALWDTASANLGSLISKYSSSLVNMGTFILTKFAGKTIDFFIFILAMIFSGYLLVNSTQAVNAIRNVLERLAPKHGDILLTIIRETIHNISIGVIGIALLQSLLFGSLLFLCGMPGAGLLTFLALILSIAQLGLLVLIVPVIIWLLLTQSLTVTIIFGSLIALTGLVDNFLKPFVLSHGLGTPMIVILLGVLGGLLLHGLIGIFIGPVVLAVSYELIKDWL